MVEFAWSDDPEDYDVGSVAVHRVSPAGEVKGDDPGPPVWELGVVQMTPLIK